MRINLLAIVLIISTIDKFEMIRGESLEMSSQEVETIRFRGPTRPKFPGPFKTVFIPSS